MWASGFPPVWHMFEMQWSHTPEARLDMPSLRLEMEEDRAAAVKTAEDLTSDQVMDESSLNSSWSRARLAFTFMQFIHLLTLEKTLLPIGHSISGICNQSEYNVHVEYHVEDLNQVCFPSSIDVKLQKVHMPVCFSYACSYLTHQNTTSGWLTDMKDEMLK